MHRAYTGLLHPSQAEEELQPVQEPRPRLPAPPVTKPLPPPLAVPTQVTAARMAKACVLVQVTAMPAAMPK